MNPKIKSISEAYSMQPNNLEVSTQERYDEYKNLEARKSFVKEIKMETVIVGANGFQDPVVIYVGYGFEGQKLFQYLANSVNVHFQPE